MDYYSRGEFRVGEGGGGFNACTVMTRREALCMFTPARWKRIIHGLVWSVEGNGTVVFQPSLQEEAF